jgi:hypothetical protein
MKHRSGRDEHGEWSTWEVGGLLVEIEEDYDLPRSWGVCLVRREVWMLEMNWGGAVIRFQFR